MPNSKEPTFMKHERITPDDVIEPVRFIPDLIREAVKEANKRNIRANMLLINDRLIWSKLSKPPYDVPMICGLRCAYTEDLPDEVLFSVFHADSPPLILKEQYERLEAENKALREKLESIISLITEE